MPFHNSELNNWNHLHMIILLGRAKKSPKLQQKFKGKGLLKFQLIIT